jgi:outer membrane cobalamin receptor
VKKLTVFIVTALTVAVPAVAAEDENELPDVMAGEPIVITVVGVPTPESEVPFGVDVITDAEMALLEPDDLGDALIGTPGVQIREWGGIGAVSAIAVRGGKGNETLVLIDGQPINNPQGGDVNVSSIPLADAERVEILSGASSALYGADAAAGVVNVITSEPSGSPEFRFKSSYGTYDTLKSELRGGVPLGPVWAAFGGEYKKSDGFRQNDDYEARTFFAGSTYEFSMAQEISGRVQFYKGEVGSPGPLSFEDSTARLNDDDLYLNVRYAGSFIGGLYSPDVAFYYNEIDRRYESVLWGIDDRHENRFYGITARNYIRPVAWNRFCAGAEFGRARTDSTSVGKIKEDNFAFILQDEVEVGGLNVVAGVRYDHNENYGSQVSPRAGARYRIVDWLNVRAAFGEGFRAPTFDELFWPDTVFYAGNPDLVPEKNSSYEGGVEFVYPGKGTSFEFTYFRSDYRNLIVNVTDDEPPYVTKPENVAEALISGIELSGKAAPLALVGVETPVVGVSGSLTHLLKVQGRSEGEELERLDYRPKTSAFVEVTYVQPLLGGISLEPSFNAEYVSSNQYTYVDPITYETEKRFLKPYTLVGFRTAARVRNFEPYFAVNNLGDVDYQTIYDYPMPGRIFTGGITISY